MPTRAVSWALVFLSCPIFSVLSPFWENKSRLRMSPFCLSLYPHIFLNLIGLWDHLVLCVSSAVVARQRPVCVPPCRGTDSIENIVPTNLFYCCIRIRCCGYTFIESLSKFSRTKGGWSCGSTHTTSALDRDAGFTPAGFTIGKWALNTRWTMSGWGDNINMNLKEMRCLK